MAQLSIKQENNYELVLYWLCVQYLDLSTLLFKIYYMNIHADIIKVKAGNPYWNFLNFF